MKLREVAVWILLLIAIILLIYSGCGNNPVNKPVYVSGKTDTIIKKDTITIERLVDRLVPYKVEVYTKLDQDSNMAEFGHFNTDPCDSIRSYSDSLSNKYSKAVVKSKVKGSLINQNIIMTSYVLDTFLSRIDTIIIPDKSVVSFGVHASADILEGPGAGIDIELNRLRIGYTYFPFSRANQIMVGYRLFRK